MPYWGYFLTGAFRLFNTLPIDKRQDWYPPVKLLFYVISVVAVALTYLATLLFAITLKKVNLMSSGACRWYLGMSIIDILLAMLPPSIPEPLATVSYLAAIPAIPFIMPYLLGIRLMRFNRSA